MRSYHTGLVWALDPMTGFNMESDLETPIHAQREEGHVMVEADIGVIWTK